MTSSLILNQPGFVLENARLLAHASAAAYAEVVGRVPSPGVGVDLRTPAEGAGPTVLTNAATDTHVTLTEYDDCTVIAFRGTQDLRNWITDAEFQKRGLGSGVSVLGKAGKGRVHAGFLTAIDSVMAEITTKLTSVAAGSPQTPDPKPQTPILLTGHSLGGALAVLCAWCLEAQNIPVHSVYTFGQPRVGDRAFAAAYATHHLSHLTFRIVNQNDLIPRLPGVLLGYCHAGQLAFINANGVLVENPSDLGLLISDLLGLYRAYRKLDDVLITDHFMAAYVVALEGAEPQKFGKQKAEINTETTRCQSSFLLSAFCFQFCPHLLAQQTLDAIPASTLKWVLAILLVLLGVAGAVVFIIVSFRPPAPVKLDDAPPIEVRRAPKTYNHEATEARLAEIDRRLEAHAGELRAIQEDRIKTLRHINQRFERVLVGIASIAGHVGAKLPAADEKEN